MIGDEVEPCDVGQRLKTLAALEDGWLDGEGAKVTDAAIATSSTHLARMERDGCPRPRVFPTPAGGLQAEWSFQEWEVTAEFFHDGAEVELIGVHVNTGAAKCEVVRLAEAGGALSEFVLGFGSRGEQGGTSSARPSHRGSDVPE